MKWRIEIWLYKENEAPSFGTSGNNFCVCVCVCVCVYVCLCGGVCVDNFLEGGDFVFKYLSVFHYFF